MRLRVDRLEERDVPAVWKNLTGDYDAGNLANWEFSAYEPNDHVSIAYFFGGPYGCVDPCEGLAGHFDSISVASNYTGTITLGGPVVTWWLYQAGGTIDQPLGDGSPITVLEAWNWYGGTLNSTSTPSTITVDGSNGYANATIAPAGGGAVITGSTINFINGTVATFDCGTVVFTAGDGLYVAASQADVNAPVTFARGAGANGPGQIRLGEGSSYHVKRANLSQIGIHHTDMAILNEAGNLTIDGGDSC